MTREDVNLPFISLRDCRSMTFLLVSIVTGRDITKQTRFNLFLLHLTYYDTVVEL